MAIYQRNTDTGEIEKKHSGRVVSVSRTWNNDRYEYSDYAVVFDSDNCGFSNIFLGIDYLDGHSSMYGDNSVIDATPEVKELHLAYIAGHRKMHDREYAQKLVKKGIPADIVKSFMEWKDSGVRSRDVYPIEDLLCLKPRTDFKKSLQSQVVEYFQKPISERKFRLPLSDKQYNCLTRYSRRY